MYISVLAVKFWALSVPIVLRLHDNYILIISIYDLLEKGTLRKKKKTRPFKHQLQGRRVWRDVGFRSSQKPYGRPQTVCFSPVKVSSRTQRRDDVMEHLYGVLRSNKFLSFWQETRYHILYNPVTRNRR